MVLKKLHNECNDITLGRHGEKQELERGCFNK